MDNNFISREDLFSFLDRGIEKSIERHKLDLTSSAQKYLVEMLEHFAETFGVEQDTWLTPITFQYQRVTEETNRMQRTQLQKELGDHCLLLVGFFYDYVSRHGEGQVKYHIQLGSTAYLQTGKLPYVELGEKFNELYLVIGDLHLPTINNEKIVGLYEKWLETGDRYYESLLMGKGVMPNRSKTENN